MIIHDDKQNQGFVGRGGGGVEVRKGCGAVVGKESSKIFIKI